MLFFGGEKLNLKYTTRNKDENRTIMKSFFKLIFIWFSPTPPQKKEIIYFMASFSFPIREINVRSFFGAGWGKWNLAFFSWSVNSIKSRPLINLKILVTYFLCDILNTDWLEFHTKTHVNIHYDDVLIYNSIVRRITSPGFLIISDDGRLGENFQWWTEKLFSRTCAGGESAHFKVGKF